MAISFERGVDSRKILVKKNGIILRSFDVQDNVTILSTRESGVENDNMIRLINQHETFEFDWREVTPPAMSRNDLVQTLVENFFFDVGLIGDTLLKVAYYAEITTISGQITAPPDTQILLNQWANGVDALVCKIVGGKPDFVDTPVDVLTFDVSGNYQLSAAVPSTPAALIYYLSVSLKNLKNLDIEYVIEYAELTSGLGNPVTSIQFDTTNNVDPVLGELRWNSDDDTLDLGVINGSVLQIGQEMFYLVKNQTGVTIPNGTAVRFAGTLGNSGRILCAPFLANGVYDSKYFMGIATHNIPNGSDGLVTFFGKIRGVNTTGQNGETWVDGDVLYCSPTHIGGLTKFQPQAPNNNITACAVIHASANGTLFIRTTFTPRLADLQDVDGTPLTTTGQILVWNNLLGVFDFTENILTYQKYINLTISSNTTLSDVHANVRITGGNVTLPLTPATGRTFKLVNDSSGSVKILGNGNLIVDVPEFTLYPQESIEIVFISKWLVI